MPDKRGPMGLRERKKARTRELLIETAAALFLEQGFEASSVEQIVNQAEVSPRTFYRYFATKEAVVFPNHATRVARFREILARHTPRERPLVAITKALTEFGTEMQERRDELFREWRIVTSSPALIARSLELELDFERAIADALLAADRAKRFSEPRARIMASGIYGLIRATLREWYDIACTRTLMEMTVDLQWILGEFPPAPEYDAEP